MLELLRPRYAGAAEATMENGQGERKSARVRAMRSVQRAEVATSKGSYKEAANARYNGTPTYVLLELLRLLWNMISRRVRAPTSKR